MAVARALDEAKIAQFNELYAAFAAATAEAGKVLETQGFGPAFLEADKKAGLLMEQINKLIGRSHWMG